MGDGAQVKLLGLTGLPRSGKDTFAARLRHEHGYQGFAFADPLKAAAAVLLDRPLGDMFGLDGFDREAPLPLWGFSTRWFLQVLGTECLRQQVSADFWVKRLRVELLRVRPQRAVITDCRFPNEVELIHELGGLVVEITRPGCVASNHASDRGVEADITIPNNGTVADLWQLADSLA